MGLGVHYVSSSPFEDSEISHNQRGLKIGSKGKSVQCPGRESVSGFILAHYSPLGTEAVTLICKEFGCGL